MVVDMLEGFTRLGRLASPRCDALVAGQAEFLRRLPAGTLTVFLGDEHEPDDAELERFGPHCLRGTREAEIRSELLEAARAARCHVRIFRKRTFSGFLNSDLDRLVAASGDDEWWVFGCVTDCCVETNVAELALRGQRVAVIRDLIDTWELSPEQVRAKGLGPAHVHSAEEVNRLWFEHRFPAVWGARVVETWRDLLPQD